MDRLASENLSRLCSHWPDLLWRSSTTSVSWCRTRTSTRKTGTSGRLTMRVWILRAQWNSRRQRSPRKLLRILEKGFFVIYLQFKSEHTNNLNTGLLKSGFIWKPHFTCLVSKCQKSCDLLKSPNFRCHLNSLLWRTGIVSTILILDKYSIQIVTG